MHNDQEELLFEEALKRQSAEARAAFLDDACRGRPELRARLDVLLEGHFMAETFLHDASDAPQPGADDQTGATIGRYKVLEKIGEGGFGIVYQAEQREPVKRRVALKIIKPGMDTKQVVARFEAERQALALMDHPGIARVFDGGATETGRPYFVMELVSGVPITTYCGEHQLSTEERLRLFVQVCEAVQHAHQKGIIHRDLKPSNILVTVINGRAVPKVIDFGVAKATQQELTEKTVFTQFHHFIGTPAYVSPEQAQLTSQDIDTRSDIYALGVLLYELLTGKTPFDGRQLLAAGLDEMRRIIREVEPAKPSRVVERESELRVERARARGVTDSTLNSQLQSLSTDLDWIVMKCLEKDRTHRYETAIGLATDILHHLNKEPIVARPPSRLYRFQKSVQRNKLAFGAATAVALAIVIGFAVSTAMFFKAQAEKKKAQTEAAKSQQVAQFLKVMLDGVGHAVAVSHDTTPVRELLDNTVKQVEMDFSDRPEVEADLLQTIGTVYFQTGPIDKAEAVQREALAIKRNLGGDRRLDIAELLSSLGLTLRRQDKLTQAESVLRESLALQTTVLGSDNPQMAMTLIHLGDVLKEQRQLDESETVLREALRLSAKAPGNGDWKLACPLRHLGATLQVKGKLAEAEQVLREAVAADRKLLGNEDFWTGESLRFLGAALHRSGKLTEAESVLRESLAILRKMPSQKEGPHLGWVLNDLAAVLRTLGRAAEAEELERESSAIKTRYQPASNETSR